MNFSTSEILDKLSILELKRKYIKNVDKLVNIITEIDYIKSLNLNTESLEYKCLYIINEYIWHLMDKTKTVDLNTIEYKLLCFQIFQENDARYRCKKLLNTNEEKSYGKSTVIFIGFPEMHPSIKESYTIFLNLYFDNIVYVDDESKIDPYLKYDFIYNILNNNTLSIKYSFLYNLDKKLLIDCIIHHQNIDISESSYNYLNSGKLGDLIHVLYVIKHIYLTTGKKGNLYISNNGDGFGNIVKTHNDIKNLILAQEYINTFNILPNNNIVIDYNLNNWRHSNMLFKEDWITLLSDYYKLKYLKMSWFKYYYFIPKNNNIIINRSTKLHNILFPWEYIISNNKCYFLTFINTDYENFKYKDSVTCLKAESFDEGVKYISSYKQYVGNQSAPLAIAYALGQNYIGELAYPDDAHYKNLPILYNLNN